MVSHESFYCDLTVDQLGLDLIVAQQITPEQFNPSNPAHMQYLRVLEEQVQRLKAITAPQFDDHDYSI